MLIAVYSGGSVIHGRGVPSVEGRTPSVDDHEGWPQFLGPAERTVCVCLLHKQCFPPWVLAGFRGRGLVTVTLSLVLVLMTKSICRSCREKSLRQSPSVVGGKFLTLKDCGLRVDLPRLPREKGVVSFGRLTTRGQKRAGYETSFRHSPTVVCR